MRSFATKIAPRSAPISLQRWAGQGLGGNLGTSDLPSRFPPLGAARRPRAKPVRPARPVRPAKRGEAVAANPAAASRRRRRLNSVARERERPEIVRSLAQRQSKARTGSGLYFYPQVSPGVSSLAAFAPSLPLGRGSRSPARRPLPRILIHKSKWIGLLAARPDGQRGNSAAIRMARSSTPGRSVA